MSEVIKGKLFV